MVAAVATGLRYYVDRRIASLSTVEQATRLERKDKENAEREAALKAQLQGAEEKLNESVARLAKIEEKVVPRSITKAQQSALVKEIVDCPFKTVVITATIGDSEAMQFAKVLENMFKSAGWKTNGILQGAFGGVPVGVIFRVPSREKAHPCAGHIQDLFRGMGIDAPGEIVPGASSEVLDIVVGRKP